ncbi:MAG: biopolymer transporter ExbD [Thermoguttaceae bacterium]|nr:biopolymer transporter ExbD [Thermoguttaceae bacterium]
MKAPLSRPGEIPDLNMTSMIDVIFLLLIFFVFTANFDELERLLPMNLTLPGTTAQEKTVEIPEEQTVTIRLFGSAQSPPSWEIGEEHFSDRTALEKRIGGYSESTTIIIAPDGTVPIESVLDLYDLCRQSGLERLQFLAKKS